MIREANGALEVTMGDRAAPLLRVRGDAFYVQWFPNDSPDRVTFANESLEWRGRTFRKAQ